METGPSSSSSARTWSSEAGVEWCYGSLVNITTKSDIRYEGFLSAVDARLQAITLRTVRSYGTEGRKKDGPQVLPIQTPLESLTFHSKEIKELVVVSMPSSDLSELHDDPAIVKIHPKSSQLAASSPGQQIVTHTGVSKLRQFDVAWPVTNTGFAPQNVSAPMNFIPQSAVQCQGHSSDIVHNQHHAHSSQPLGKMLSPPVQKQQSDPLKQTFNEKMPPQFGNRNTLAVPLPPNLFQNANYDSGHASINSSSFYLSSDMNTRSPLSSNQHAKRQAGNATRVPQELLPPDQHNYPDAESSLSQSLYGDMTSNKALSKQTITPDHDSVPAQEFLFPLGHSSQKKLESTQHGCANSDVPQAIFRGRQSRGRQRFSGRNRGRGRGRGRSDYHGGGPGHKGPG